MSIIQLDFLKGYETPQRMKSIRWEYLNVVDVGLHFLSDNLKKKGQNYIGRCIFHIEKTPSFLLRSLQNEFKCYGCNKRGGPFEMLLSLTNDPINYLERQFNFNIKSSKEVSRLMKIISSEKFDLITNYSWKLYIKSSSKN